MKLTAKFLLLFATLAALVGCGANSSVSTATRRDVAQASAATASAATRPAEPAHAPVPYNGKMIHVFVALCDNVNQGIVPVSPALGNGEDPARNLYWGARFGVKTHFKNSKEWKLVAELQNPRAPILERLIFKHKTEDAFLVADAYRGAEIKQATVDFLEAASGASREEINIEGRKFGLSKGARAHMVAYVGHDGLMDFRLTSYAKRQDDATRDAVILACFSKSYFTAPLRETGANPLLWTTNLMAPEAYVLKAATDGWLAGESGAQVRERAAKAYHAYQKCGLKAARGLFASGW